MIAKTITSDTQSLKTLEIVVYSHPSPSHLLLSMGTNSLDLLTNINLIENKGGKGGRKAQKRDREKDRHKRKRKRTNAMLNLTC